MGTPTPIQETITDRTTPARRENNRVLYEDDRSLPVFIGEAKEITAKVLRDLDEVLEAALRSGSQAKLGVPARLEFFRLERGKQGLTIFDGRNRLIVHIVDALLGGDDDSSKLCRAVMQKLDVQLELIEQVLQGVHRDQRYVVVLTRSKSELFNRIEVAASTLEVENVWRHQRVK